ncbi:biopolymer transporter ExbB [Sphingomonas sp. Leaf231]|uniref:motility protein A n=1 Tax=Sphingomonas sp. Leaf231 TaxID=1736301 RepID=UPI0006FD15B3|nr:MotA/TolQ/ExbB proton channel family protein [Sphingomonas sp. Leaf231]KQN92355.1 biopolymer transporter ExbB [Sphingomonas sp. Leaf231]
MTPALLFDPVALAIVLGGTTLATILRTPVRDLAHALLALRTLPRRRFRADTRLEQVTALARIAQRNGVHALDRSVIRDADVAAAIAMIVDGARGQTVADALDAARRSRGERHRIVVECWIGMAETAPAMGMIGTLIGLVAMFTRMSDPQAIGAAMAVALLATLYGALLANLVAMPIAARLRTAARAELLERERLVAPLAELAEREAPRGNARVRLHDADIATVREEAA